jgi:hypothetical protein
MSLRKTLAKLLLFAVLEIGVLAGAAMTAEEIEKVMNAMHRVKVEYVVKKEDSS